MRLGEGIQEGKILQEERLTNPIDEVPNEELREKLRNFDETFLKDFDGLRPVVDILFSIREFGIQRHDSDAVYARLRRYPTTLQFQEGTRGKRTFNVLDREHALVLMALCSCKQNYARTRASRNWDGLVIETKQQLGNGVLGTLLTLPNRKESV